MKAIDGRIPITQPELTGYLHQLPTQHSKKSLYAYVADIRKPKSNFLTDFFHYIIDCCTPTLETHVAFCNPIDLRHTDFSNLNLAYANFTNNDMSFANLCATQFLNARLYGLKCTHAKARNANFTGTDLLYADFSYTDAMYACFREANFDRSNFSFANLSRADFTGSNFFSVTLENAICIETILPEYASMRLSNTILIGAKTPDGKPLNLSHANHITGPEQLLPAITSGAISYTTGYTAAKLLLQFSKDQTNPAIAARYIESAHACIEVIHSLPFNKQPLASQKDVVVYDNAAASLWQKWQPTGIALPNEIAGLISSLTGVADLPQAARVSKPDGSYSSHIQRRRAETTVTHTLS